jgi:hypothetical protein
MHSLLGSSKDASSVAIATWISVSQKTAWKMLYALRALMAPPQGFSRRSTCDASCLWLQ